MYYIEINNELIGPLSLTDLLTYDIEADTLVLKDDGNSDWVQADQLSELKELFDTTNQIEDNVETENLYLLKQGETELGSFVINDITPELIDGGTLIWTEGMEDWQNAYQFLGIDNDEPVVIEEDNDINEIDTSNNNNRILKRIGWSLGILLILFTTIYLEQIIEIKLFLNNNSYESVNKDEYYYAKDLYDYGGFLDRNTFIGEIMQSIDLDDRGDKNSLQNWIENWEYEKSEQEYTKIKELLEQEDYYGAKNLLYSSMEGLDNSNIYSSFKDYETENFEELKESLIETELDWDYSYSSIDVPAQYETRWNQDFFGDWYSITTKSSDSYSYNEYNGAYLSLKVKNSFLVVNINGKVVVEAREKTTAGDVGTGIVGGLLTAALFSTASRVFDVGDPDDAALIGLGLGSSTIWDKERSTTIRNISIKPKNTIYHTGFVELKGKTFASGQTPKISYTVWDVE